jgi:transcriptional regulator with XRE-family HTH domain
MANMSNVNRLATARVLLSALDHFKACAGLSVQTHRAYESAARGGVGLTQEHVATAAGTNQPTVSNLEQAKSIPGDPILQNILAQAGFDMTAGTGSGHALLQILRAIRDNEGNLQNIEADRPA